MGISQISQPSDLDTLDKDTLIAFLTSDRDDKIALWNAWRSSANWKPVDLENAEMSGAYLRGVHLEKVILIEAHLEAANLIEAHLEKAILDEAHLEGARLGKAYLEGTSLGGAHLEEADLREARLRGAYLEEAHLERACLIEARLERANLTEAHLEGANLLGAQLINATLHGTRLRDVALSNVASLRGVMLYQTYLWGVLSLRYEQFLDGHGDSIIWEETEGYFREAKDVYKSLKGYFEDAGDYEGANWAHGREQVMAKLMSAPRWSRRFYPRWPGKWHDESCRPSVMRWLGLELSDKLAGFGLSLWRPLFVLAAIVLVFALLYWLSGAITSTFGCSYSELIQQWRVGCAPTSNPFDALLFSLGALTSTEIGVVRPYLSHVGILMTLEVLLGIALTGLFGFVLGNKLRYS